MSTIIETFAHCFLKIDYLWNQLARQFDGFRRDRYITCSIEKREVYVLLRCEVLVQVVFLAVARGHTMSQADRLVCPARDIQCIDERIQAATSRNVDFGRLFQTNAAYLIIGTNDGVIQA